MKRILPVLMCLFTQATFAQNVDELIQKYADALGGLDNIKKVETCKMTGTGTQQGITFPVTLQIINGKAMRLDVEVMGQKIINCYNNGTGWKQNPFEGIESPTEVVDDELAELKSQTYLANPLIDYKERGNTVELAGTENINGTDASKIILTDAATGKKTTYYLDAQTSMPIKTVSTRDINGMEMEVETFSDDLKDINGLKFFMSRSQKIDGQEILSIKFDKVELNVPIDESIFKM